MITSESVNELATALAKAQGEITGALKDSANPFFKSKYADLASCWDACRSALSKNGLAVTQFPTTEATGVCLVTTLLHSSGQWMRASLAVHPKDDSPQAMGSALTYARRYALTAVVGVAQVDDDGNAASGKVSQEDANNALFLENARKHALAMIGIIEAPAKEGDHDERQKCLEALDYHDKHLAGNNELYAEAGKQMGTAKKNIWAAVVRKGKEAKANDKAATDAGRKF